MMVEYELDAAWVAAELGEQVASLLNDPDVRMYVQEAMALRLKQLVQDNLGIVGRDRPKEWAPLNKRYAKRVMRPYATLYVSGQLSRSIKHASYPDYAIVYQDYADCPYGEVHQDGEGKMPERPFFPIVNGELTPMAQYELFDAAIKALDHIATDLNPFMERL